MKNNINSLMYKIIVNDALTASNIKTITQKWNFNKKFWAVTQEEIMFENLHEIYEYVEKIQKWTLAELHKQETREIEFFYAFLDEILSNSLLRKE